MRSGIGFACDNAEAGDTHPVTQRWQGTVLLATLMPQSLIKFSLNEQRPGLAML